MQHEYAISAHWPKAYDEAGLQIWAEKLRAQLRARQVSLGLVFMTPQFFPHARPVLEILRVHAQIPLLAGCSSASLIVQDREVEENAGLVLGLYWMPGAELKAFHFAQEEVEAADGPGYWHSKTGIPGDQTNGWLAFAD